MDTAQDFQAATEPLRKDCTVRALIAAMTLDVDKQIAALDKAVDDALDSIGRVHGPSWEDRSDFVRNIVTVASAIFAASITFLDQAATGHKSITTLLVLICWFLLLLAICTGLYALWHAANLRSAYPRYFNRRPKIREEFAAIDPSASDVDARATAVARKHVDGVLAPTGASDARAQRAVRACVWLFALGLACLFVYGVCRVCGWTP